MADKKGIKEVISIPEGCTVTVDKGVIKVKGPKGENERKLIDNNLKITVEENKIILSYEVAKKKEKKKMYTMLAHVKNLLKGVTEGFTYKLKVCSGHFPMTVSLKGDQFEIKNFIGEQVPRRLKIKPGANVKIQGDIIIVESIDKEKAGQTAAAIESLTKRPGFDKRVFQDGIYITDKDGKLM